MLFIFDIERSFHGLSFRNPNFEKALFESCPNRLRVKACLDGDLAFEGSERDLHLLEAIDLGSRRWATYTAQAQYGALDVHSEIFPANAGDFETNDDLGVRLEDVGRGMPSIATKSVGKFPVEFYQGIWSILLTNRRSPA